MAMTTGLLATLAVTPTRHVNPLQTAIAHQVEIADDIGATLHIEPNDTPRAGEATLAWFALTKKGGQIIPLADCNCQIQLYEQSDQQTPVASPTPQPVDSEGYQGIPGAEITFPDVGAYTLVISGGPKNEASFTPFELAFDVTVAAGTSVSEPASANNEAPAVETPADTASTADATPTVEDVAEQTGLPVSLRVIAVAVTGAVVVGAIALKRKQS